jgi:hypothetical protein
MQNDAIEMLANRGIDLAALGGAYLVFLANLVLTIAFFVGSRSWLVISPNRVAKHYGLYVVVVASSLIVATVLENQLVPRQAAAVLPYAAIPHLAILLMVHLWIYYKPEPWLIAVGASANAAMIATIAVASLAGGPVRAPHWLSAAVLAALLGYLSYRSISTQRGFVKARSIYASSKERGEGRPAPQVPWLGLPQWAALIGASVGLAILNSLLQGRGLDEIRAVAIVGQSASMLLATACIGTIPATTYWLAHKQWMPELTRFVWLAWIVVGFAFTYGNVLTRLDRV